MPSFDFESKILRAGAYETLRVDADAWPPGLRVSKVRIDSAALQDLLVAGLTVDGQPVHLGTFERCGVGEIGVSPTPIQKGVAVTLKNIGTQSVAVSGSVILIR